MNCVDWRRGIDAVDELAFFVSSLADRLVIWHTCQGEGRCMDQSTTVALAFGVTGFVAAGADGFYGPIDDRQRAARPRRGGE